MDMDYLKRRAITDSTATLILLGTFANNNSPAYAENLPVSDVGSTTTTTIQQPTKPCPYSEADLSELDMRVLASLAQKMQGSPEEIVCEIREIASHLPPKERPTMLEQIKSWGPTELTTIGAAVMAGVGVEKFKEWQDKRKREVLKKQKEEKNTKQLIL